MRCCFTLILALLLAHYAAASHHEQSKKPPFSVGQEIQTSSGLILGQPALSRPEVSEYLGIPFAKPPVGDFRFAAPQAYSGNGTVNATAFVCYHLFVSNWDVVF